MGGLFFNSSNVNWNIDVLCMNSIPLVYNKALQPDRHPSSLARMAFNSYYLSNKLCAIPAPAG